ncbi:MAG: hypothetical protein ACXWNL_17370 [Vulcanimicrobiaceae bacterium]
MAKLHRYHDMTSSLRILLCALMTAARWDNPPPREFKFIIAIEAVTRA